MPDRSLRLLLFLLAFLSSGCWSGTVPVASAPGDGAVQAAGERVSDGARLEEVLAGKVPGLTVLRRTDGTYVIRLRHARASADGEPLVLLDGVPLSGGTGPALAHINPQDVERVEVIKDAASLSLYGTRGANGVIAITTRTR